MISKILYTILFVTLTNAEIATEKGVLVLNDDNFDEAIEAHEFLLVEFYAPWCGHCKKLAPEWDKAAAALVGEDAKLAKVDATVATELAERFAIRGFPTINFFKNGKQIEYGGGRVASEIVSWVKKQSGPSAKTITTAEELVTAQETEDAIIVGYFSSLDSDNAKSFLTVAGSDDVLNYFISSSDIIKEKLAVSGDAIVILKPFDNKRDELSVGDSFDTETVVTFIIGNSVPLVQTFSQESAKKIFSSPVQKHCLFFTETSADHHAPVVTALTSVAETFRGQTLVVNVPSTEDRVLDYFGIAKDTLPALVVVDMSGEGQMKKYPYSGDLQSSTAVSEHVSAVLSGSVKPTLKSEDPSPEDTTSDVVVLRGSTFNDLVINNNKDVLVEFYAPWCGHCKKLAPTYDELGAKFRSNENIVIAKMDATANEVDVPGLNVKGFPTLYFFPGKDKTPVKYDGGREVDDFVEWIKENASNDAKHDEL